MSASTRSSHRRRPPSSPARGLDRLPSHRRAVRRRGGLELAGLAAHAIFVDHGAAAAVEHRRQRVRDFHLGYGAMVMGDALRRSSSDPEAGAARHALRSADDGPARGGTTSSNDSVCRCALLQLGHRGHAGGGAPDAAKTGRDIIIKIKGSYHGHHDALMSRRAPDAT